MNKKICDCSFCSQFLYTRLQKYSHLKKNQKNQTNQKNQVDVINQTNQVDVINQIKNDKSFTLEELNNVITLKSMKLETEEISQQTNLSYSMVIYILELIYWK